MESAAPASSLSLTLFNPFISSSPLKSRLYTSCGIAAHSDVFCFVCSITSFSLPPCSPCHLSRSSVGALQRSRLLHTMFLLAEHRKSERSELSTNTNSTKNDFQKAFFVFNKMSRFQLDYLLLASLPVLVSTTLHASALFALVNQYALQN